MSSFCCDSSCLHPAVVPHVFMLLWFLMCSCCCGSSCVHSAEGQAVQLSADGEGAPGAEEEAGGSGGGACGASVRRSVRGSALQPRGLQHPPGTARTHSHTHTITHSLRLTHSHSHTLTKTHTITQSHTHSLTHSLTRPPACSLTDSLAP